MGEREQGFEMAYRGKNLPDNATRDMKEGFSDFCPSCAMIGGYCGGCTGDYFSYTYNFELKKFERR